MPTNIVPAGTWTGVVPAPDDGEPVERAAVIQYAQPILDRTEFTKDALEGKNVTVARFGVRTAAPVNVVIAPGRTQILMLNVASALVGDEVSVRGYINWGFNPGTALTGVTMELDIDGVTQADTIPDVLDPALTNGSITNVAWEWFHTVVVPGPQTLQLFGFKGVLGPDASALQASLHYVHSRAITF